MHASFFRFVSCNLFEQRPDCICYSVIHGLLERPNTGANNIICIIIEIRAYRVGNIYFAR
ncbi:hypothetical protein NI18_18035 [Sphingomonas sp. Ant20]|nr:hypothetical protein NI18_18035 [Sphingomonas sp. Ant20]